MKKKLDDVITRILGWLIWCLTNLLSLTIRWVLIGNDRFNDVMSKTAVVAVFWHGQFLALPYLNKKKRVAIIISSSRDGDIAADVIKRYGFEVIRGSSTRGGETATREAIKYIKNNYTIGLTGDGPKGPYHILKPGPVWFAQKMDIPIVPVTVNFKHYIQIKSWDKFLIPLPFTRGIVIYGEPVSVKGLQRREGMRVVQHKMEEQELTAINMLK
ncbi:MAG: lysophospholipid acyltransferase family protein [bacterium]